MPADRVSPRDAAPSRVPDEVLAEVASAGADDAGGLPVELLGDFLPVLVEAVAAGEPIGPARLRAYRVVGDRAATQGVALRALLDLYLSAAWRLWRHLPPVAHPTRDPHGVVRAGEVMLHATDDVVAALTEGYQLARQALTRAQESARREFIDDLLGGGADVVGLLARADGFGLDLSGPHAVLSVRTEPEVSEGGPLFARIDRAVQGRKGDAQALLVTKEGQLVLVFAAPDRLAVEQTTRQVADTLDATRGRRGGVRRWQMGVGRVGPGPGGVTASYREARDALVLADRLGLDQPVVYARDLLAYRVLLRDRVVLRDLVEDALGALRGARGGAGPLIDTLVAYFASGANAASCARTLHLSVRAVTYRLDRVRDLTGLDPTAAGDLFTLHVAALGARLLDWPPG